MSVFIAIASSLSNCIDIDRDHHSCHICERQGIIYQYYKNYEALESHFRAAHFICEDPRCLTNRFVVFSDSIDLTTHTLNYHPSQV